MQATCMQGVNGGIYSLIAALAYGVALAKGEEMEIERENWVGEGVCKV